MEKDFSLNGFLQGKSFLERLDEIREKEKKRRKEKGWTQQQLAANSGVSYASLRRFESQGDIELRSLIKIMQALGDDDELDDLFAHPIFAWKEEGR